ncbi:ParB/RepB/Spo0J family partition protein [Myxococcota bacterium]|nr:ParB/RepB/Spo0J family partition protein [Myxococcota bacterium]
MNGTKRSALGRGLASLIPEAVAPSPTSSPSPAGSVLQVPLDQVRPNPRQPRKHFDERGLTGLVESIRANGVLQPILLRRAAQGYEIIAGERRFRAAGRAGLHAIPALVRDIPGDGESLELALLENLQREDLNPVETAEGYQRLLEEFKYTQDELARRLGRDRTSITNLLRLLRLPEEVQDALVTGVITAGHGKALLGLEDEDAIRTAFQRLVERQLNVRQTELLVKQLRDGGGAPPAAASPDASRAVRQVSERLSRYLGTRVIVQAKKRGRGGRIVLEYYSDEDLSRLVDQIETSL